MRRPPILDDGIDAASKRVTNTMEVFKVSGNWMKLLKLYRRWRRWPGIDALLFGLGLDELQRMPKPPVEFSKRPATWASLVPLLQSLDDAVARYNEFNPEDYVSGAVVGVIQSRRAKVPRGRRDATLSSDRRLSAEARDRQIMDHLKSIGYEKSDNKGELVKSTARKFATNERAVREAARAAGLVRSYRKRASGAETA